MTQILINSARTCAFTGHRAMEQGYDTSDLLDKINKLIGIGYDTFLVGMALGFDTLVFNLLEQVRKTKNIRIIACIPCISQAYRFTIPQKIEYERMLDSANERIYVGKEYTDKCMLKRNEFMVKNSSCLIAYVRRNYGGSAYTVKYAIKNGITVISV